jgi:hypothetical protein
MSVNMIVKVYFIAVLKTGITITIKSSKMSTGISNEILLVIFSFLFSKTKSVRYLDRQSDGGVDPFVYRQETVCLLFKVL